MRSIEIIQKSGINALVYGNDSANPGEHVEVFTGRDALDRAQVWVAAETLVHHDSQTHPVIAGNDDHYFTTNWREVTCGDCRLEEPFVPEREHELSPEVVRQHSLAAQAPAAFLATLEHVAMWQKRLAKLQALEEAALDLAAHWARTVAELTKVREATEKALRLAQSGQESSGVAADRSGDLEPQRAAERATGVITWQDAQAARDRIPVTYGRVALVNSVDIRTDVREDEGMTNTKPQLSEDAKSALVNVFRRIGKGARVVAGTSPGVMEELRTAGLIGQEGGLTVAGTVARNRLISEAEEKAFGPL